VQGPGRLPELWRPAHDRAFVLPDVFGNDAVEPAGSRRFDLCRAHHAWPTGASRRSWTAW
jgi:hypothetical protein